MNAMTHWSMSALMALIICMSACPAGAVPESAGEKAAPSAAQDGTKEKEADRAAPSGKPEEKAAEGEAQAALKGKVLLPSAGEWMWWVQDAGGDTVAGPSMAKGEEFEWSAEGLEKPDGVLRVMDRGTGNVASVPLPEAEGKEVKLVEADFPAVHRLRVKVSSKSGEPVAAAFVRLTDSAGNRQTRLLAETDRGEAVFHDVALGKASIEVRSGDVAVTQELRLERKREQPEAVAEVVLAGDVPVAAPAEGAEGGEKEKATPAHRAATLQAVVSLILLAAVVVIVAIALRNRRVTLRSALQKAGIPIEEDQPQGGPLPSPAPGAPPLDPDLVGPAPTAPPQPAAGAAPASGPKLVGVAGRYAGAVFPVGGAQAVIGREATCDIALTDDATASRRHATITRTGDAFVIRDEGSSNGTLVNGLKVTEQPLKDGDEVQIGSTRFRFEV